MDKTFRKLLEAQASPRAAWLRQRIAAVEEALETRAGNNDPPEKLALLREALVDELTVELDERRAADLAADRAKLVELETTWRKANTPRDPAAALLEFQKLQAKYAAMTPGEVQTIYNRYQADPTQHLGLDEIDVLRAAYLRHFPAGPPKPGSDKIPDSYRLAVAEKGDDRPWMTPEARALENRLQHEDRLPAGSVLLEAEGQPVVGEGAPAPEGPSTAFIGVRIADLV